MPLELDVLRGRLEEAQARVEKAREALRDGQRNLNQALRECEVWRSALALENGERIDVQTEDNRKLVDRVREMLNMHPNGITAKEMSSAMEGTFAGRKPYMYQILKRLMDSGEVVRDGHRYFIKTHATNPVQDKRGN
jgi:hypothetical protein